MNQKPHRRGKLATPVTFLAALLSTSAAMSLLSRLPGSERLSSLSVVTMVGICAIGIWFILRPSSVRLADWLLGMNVRGRCSALIAAPLIGFIWVFALPVAVAPDSEADVTVSVLAGQNENAQGREVWLRLERDGKDIPFTEIEQNGEWLDKSPFLVAVNPDKPASVHWRGRYSDDLRLVFISHPWSGRARVTWDDKSKDLDLYGPDGGSAVLNLGGSAPTEAKLSFPDRNIRQWTTAVSDALLLGTLALAVFAFLVRRPERQVDGSTPGRVPVREAFAFSIPLLVTSACSLLIFYPGLMTSDSLDQWRQAGRMAFNDAHPLLYGFFIAGMRSIWDSPAAVAVAQLLLFALACGWLISSVRHIVQARDRIAWAAAWLVALYPLIPLTAVTLWKDVPYAAAVIALTAFLMSALARSRESKLSLAATVGLALLMFCAMALRHNGPPVAFAAALVVFLYLKKSRIQAIAALIGALLLMVMLKGPVSDAVGIERKPVSYILYSHHIAAHLSADHLPENRDDADLLRKLNHEDSDWSYNCATVNPIVFNPHFDSKEAMARNDDLFRIWRGLAASRPGIEYDHGLCSSGLIWRVLDSDRDPLYLSGVGLWAPHGEVQWIGGTRGDPLQASKSPELAEFVGKLVLLPNMQAAFRPALFMYALIFACAVAVARRRDAQLLLLLSLPAVHTAFLAVSIVAQDARYQLPLYVIALASVPLLLGSRRRAHTSSGPRE